MTRLPRRAVGLGAMLVAALALLHQFADGRDEAIEPTVSARESLAPALVEGSKLQPLSAYEIIEARPLLSPTRRPQPLRAQPAPAAPVPQSSPSPEAPTLVGTLVASERRMAFVRVDGSRTVTVAEGGAVAGWTVDLVQPGEAVFRMGARVIPIKVSWSTARQNTAATPLVADISAMAMRGRGGWSGRP